MKFGKKKDKEKSNVVGGGVDDTSTTTTTNTSNNTTKKTKKDKKVKKIKDNNIDPQASSTPTNNNSSSSSPSKVFGGPLPTVDSEEIPLVIVQTVEYLECHGLTTSGIFRESGSQQLINQYKQLFESNQPVVFADHEQHVVASVLKAYLRELQDPLLSFENYDMFVACESINDDTVKLEIVKKVIKLLPLNNIRIIKYLFNFLCKVVEHSDQNKMTAESLSIVFLPTILRPRAESDHQILQYTVEDAKSTKTLMSTIIKNYEAIFEDPSVLMPRTRQVRAVTEFVSSSSPYKISSPPQPISPTKSINSQISSPDKSSSADSFKSLLISPHPPPPLLTTIDETGRQEYDSSGRISTQQHDEKIVKSLPPTLNNNNTPLNNNNHTHTNNFNNNNNNGGGSRIPPPLPAKPTPPPLLFVPTPVPSSSSSSSSSSAMNVLSPPKPVPKIPNQNNNNNNGGSGHSGSSLSINQSPKMTRKLMFESEGRSRSSTIV